MNAAEFDKFADEYQATHQSNIAISGETPDYFARYKIDRVRATWTGAALPEPRAILDFGAGVGNSVPHLARCFPAAEITALDVSERSLAVARARWSGAARWVRHDGGPLPFADGAFDLIFSACVFHHIPAQEHIALMRQLRRVLAPGGRLFVFEHNPINPVTRYIVATCPFDAEAVLIPSGVLRRRQKAAGFKRVSRAYTGFFPAALKPLRPLETFLAGLPIGAQYFTQAHG